LKKKKILLVLTEFPPSIGGMQTHALYLSNFLAEQNYDIQVVTYRIGAGEQESIQKYDSQLNFPVHRILSRLGFWYSIDMLKDVITQFKPQLVYCSNVFYGVLKNEIDIPIVCRSVGNDILRPWIAYPFRFGSHWLAHPEFEYKAYKYFKKWKTPTIIEAILRQQRFDLAYRSARSMNLIIANSHFTAGLLQEVGVESERIHVVVGGVDTHRFADGKHQTKEALRQEYSIPQDAFVILTVCRSVPKKGVEFLLQAFKEIKLQIDNVHLVVVGDGRYNRRYKKLASSLKIRENVTFTGWIDHLKVHQFYKLSDLFVLASYVTLNPITGVRDAETMGRVLCEANAAGLPVLASRSGGIPSVIRHEKNGLLFEPEDIQDFKKQFMVLYQSASLRSSLIQNGIEIAQQEFDWAVIMEKHIQLFNAVLDS